MHSECAYNNLGERKHSQYKLKSDTFSTTVKDAAVNHQTDSELELDNLLSRIQIT